MVAGRDERLAPARGRAVGEAAAAFAAAAGWPLLADPLSGARRGEAAIAHYDALLRDEAFAAALDPDLVLRVGDLPVSKPLRTWLAGLQGVRQVALDPDGAWQDPASVARALARARPGGRALAASSRAGRGGGDWLASWRSADELAAQAILGVLGDGELSEPAVAAELGVLLPQEATLFVASSMPVRDIETFWPVRADPPRVLCNRGANGIDGTVSSAFGAAAAGSGPVVLLIGDVALAHDIGGLLAAQRLRLKLTIVLLDNGGGGIFDFLPVADAAMARDPGRASSIAAATASLTATSTRATSPRRRGSTSPAPPGCTGSHTSGSRTSATCERRSSGRSATTARASSKSGVSARATWRFTGACGRPSPARSTRQQREQRRTA